MRLVVFGATGATGREIITQALGAGHQVRAVARRPEVLAGFDPRIEVVRGDVEDPASIAAAIDGRDAVVSALGTGGSLRATTVMSRGIAAIVGGMEAHHVTSLVYVSAAGTVPEPGDPWLLRLVVRPLLRKVFEDHRRAEAIVMATALDWTIVRPPGLRDGPRTGRYRVARDRQALRGSFLLARADVADFVVRELTAREFVRAAVAIAY